MGTVRFVKPWSVYNAGETARFDDGTAAILTGNGVAVAADDAAPPAAPSAKPTRKRRYPVAAKPAPAAD